MNTSVPNCFRACAKYTQITLCLDLRSGYVYVAFTWELPAELVLPWLTNQAVCGVTKKLSCSLKSGGKTAFKQYLREHREIKMST